MTLVGWKDVLARAVQGAGALGEGLLELTFIWKRRFGFEQQDTKRSFTNGMAHRSRFLIDNKGLKEAKAPKAAFVS